MTEGMRHKRKSHSKNGKINCRPEATLLNLRLVAGVVGVTTSGGVDKELSCKKVIAKIKYDEF